MPLSTFPPTLSQKIAENPSLVNAISMSSFIKRTLLSQPELLNQWLKNLPSAQDCTHYADRLAKILQNVQDEEQLGRELRLFRHREMATLSFIQSNKLASVEFVFQALSDLAETIILQASIVVRNTACR